QLVEQRPFKAWALGSSPRGVTESLSEMEDFFVIRCFLRPNALTTPLPFPFCSLLTNNLAFSKEFIILSFFELWFDAHR
ncbi:MAG: hypothetical protein COA38_17035, partial [Fluviicola sp.]